MISKPAITLLVLAFLTALSSAVDPTTSASATANGSSYAFGNWSTSNVTVTLACTAGTSDCNSTLYCTGASNSCDPTTGGTLYTGPVNISTEGTSYIRYASANSTGGWGDVGSSAIAIDTTAPSIAINDEASSSWTNSDTIGVSVSDAGSGIANASWIIRLNSTCDPTADADFNSSATLGTSLSANNESVYQNKYICFRATDNVGRKSYLSSSQITHVDTSAPSVNAGADVQSNSQFARNGSASDSASGIASYLWSEVSGPGSIIFGSPNSQNTTIRANQDGNYTIRLTAKDGAGNPASDEFTLTWITTAPEITIINPDSSPSQYKTITASVGGTLSMSVTAGLACDSSLTFVPYSSLTFSSEPDNGKRVCYKVVDSLGNSAYKISGPIAGIDTTKPMLTLKGPSIVSVEVFSAYADEGATSSDNRDGDLTSKIVVNNAVNKDSVGSYTVTYSVKDAAGNMANASRTVKVVDSAKPVLSLLGNSSVTVEVNSNYTDAGASASDNYDTDVSSKIVAKSTVDVQRAGTYAVIYNVADSSGNQADPVVRTVTVTDSWGWLMLAAIGIGAIVVVGVGAAAVYMLFIRKKNRGL